MGLPDSIDDIQPFLELQASGWTRSYKAFQPSLNRLVFLKILDQVHSRDPENASWFKNEAELTARINHPNVVAMYGYGESAHGLYYTAEFVEGSNLRQVLDQGRLPVNLAIYIVEHITAGLKAAHKAGVLHRDLKPENVLIATDGQIKLTDFGMASLKDASFESESIKGTPGYIAPELLFGSAPDVSTDFFALGAILFEFLSGRKAFASETPSAYIEAVQKQDPIPFLAANARIPRELVDLCANLLAKNNEKRIQDPEAILQMLHAAKEHAASNASASDLARWMENPDEYVEKLTILPSSPEPEPEAQVVERPLPEVKKRSPARVAGIAIVLLLLLSAGIASFVNRPDASTPPLSPEPEPESVTASDNSSSQADQTQEDSVSTDLESPPLIQPPARNEVAGLVDTNTSTRSTTPDSSEVTTPEDSLQTAPPILDNGTLTVLCIPGCDVFINDQDLGEAPPALSSILPAGTHTVEFRHPELPAYRSEVTLAGGASDTLSVSLLAMVGHLELVVSPWGYVSVDTTRYGVFPPFRPIYLRPGEHRVAIEHPDLGKREISIAIGAGETLHRTINLNEQRP